MVYCSRTEYANLSEKRTFSKFLAKSYPERGDNMFLLNIGTHLPYYLLS